MKQFPFSSIGASQTDTVTPSLVTPRVTFAGVEKMGRVFKDPPEQGWKHFFITTVVHSEM